VKLPSRHSGEPRRTSLGEPLSLRSLWRPSGSHWQKSKDDARCGSAVSRSPGAAPRAWTDWVAYIMGGKSKKLILADHASERNVKHLLSRLQTMSKEQIQKIAKG